MSQLIEELDKEIERLSAIKSLADGMQSYCEIFGDCLPVVLEMHITDGEDRLFASTYYFHSIFISYDAATQFIHEAGFIGDRLTLPNGDVLYARAHKMNSHSFKAQLGYF